MKLLFVIFVSALALSATDPQTQKPAPKKAAKTVQVAKPLTIPEGAVLGPDGDYRFTDAQGRKWLYRHTPFGVSKREDTGAPAVSASGPATAASPAGLKATEDGDVVHFEKPGPFGPWKWDKKKAELDEAEKAALQHAQADSKTASKQD